MLGDTEEDIIKLNLDQERQAYQARLAAEQEEREPDSAQKPKRMGSITFFLLLGLSLAADAAEAFTLGTLGWVVGTMVDAILLIVFGFSIKKQFKNVILVSIAEFIPGVDILPLRTFYMLFARYHLRSI